MPDLKKILSMMEAAQSKCQARRNEYARLSGEALRHRPELGGYFKASALYDMENAVVVALSELIQEVRALGTQKEEVAEKPLLKVAGK